MSDLLYPERLKEIMKRTGSSAYESYQLAEGLLKAKEELLRKDAEIADLQQTIGLLKHKIDGLEAEIEMIEADYGDRGWII